MKKYIAELLGTFILVFVGTSTAIFTAVSPESNGGALAVALAFGFSVVAGAYAVGHISGGHFNPAVSWGMFLSERLSFKDFLAYALAQILGGILGSATIWALFSSMQEAGAVKYAANGIGQLTPFGAILAEAVLTFIFVFVILSVTKEGFAASNLSVLIIGLSLVMLILAGANLSGASLNPARSIGPAIFAGGEALTELWVFILGPMLGASLSVLVNKYFA